MRPIVTVLLAAVGLLSPTEASATVFDFDSAPIHSPLPVDLTVDGITAHLSATGQGFSIQAANALGFTPVGFAGNCIYPSSVFLADLLVSFSAPLSSFSILYAPEEYACDSSARMRVTASLGGVYVGTATMSADPPGTWPTATLSFTSAQPFDNVVIHYDAAPPTGGDWGPVFMADNMNVTAIDLTSVPDGVGRPGLGAVAMPNPFVDQTGVRLSLAGPTSVSATIHDVGGELVRTLSTEEIMPAGGRTLAWNGRDNAGRAVRPGIYFLRVSAGGRWTTIRLARTR